MIKWLDLIDQAKLNNLVNSYNLHLNNTTRSFLESFATLVYQASNTRRKLLEAASLRKTHLHTVNSIVAHELFHLQKQFPHAHIIPYRHPETSLPIVYLRIHQFPDLVVHVFRSYATNNHGLTFGFRAYSFCRGPLTGPFASAANYLRARCTAKSWKISLSELISVWCHHVATIPIQQASPSSPSPNKPKKMIRRRRRANRSPSPPVEHQPTFQSSLPHDHPNTDVVIKDDRLFPNREFHDPEELYAEQVRAIRNKRKNPSGIIDDAELAWKKLRPSPPRQPLDEQAQQSPTSPAHPPLSSTTPQPPPRQPDFEAPAEPPALIPPLTRPAIPPPQPQPVSPNDSDDAFINPLSPERKGNSPPEETHLSDHTGEPPRVDQETPPARPRSSSPKPRTPSPTREAEADSPPPPNDDDDDDDGSTPVFSFSTAILPPAPTTSQQAPALDSYTERVKEDSMEKPELVPARSEEAEETCPADPEPAKDLIQTHPDSDSGNSVSGDDVIAKPALSLPVQEVDQGSQENECDTPTTLQNDANSISPQGSTPLVPELDRELPEKIDSVYEFGTGDLDRTRVHPDEAKASPQSEEEEVEKDNATGSIGKSRKRSRTRDDDADVILVDPDSDEEPDETNAGKKRRLSPPLDAPGSSATPNDEHSKRDVVATVEVKDRDDVPDKQKTVSERDAEIVVPENKEWVATQAEESSDRAFPQKEVSEGSGNSGANDPVDAVQEGTGIPALRLSSAREVTRDVEGSLMRYAGPSIPDGVDRDPCPLALSEPSQSSEGSSDDDSSSDTGSVSSGALDADDERE